MPFLGLTPALVARGLVMTGNARLVIGLVWAIFVVFTVHSLDFPGSVPRFKATSGGQDLLDTHPSFDLDGVYQRLEAYGEEGREAYSFRLATVDVLLPLSVLPFLYLFMAKAAARLSLQRGMRRVLLAIPFTYLLFDLAENAALFVLLDNYPERMPVLALLLPYLTLIKRLASVAGFLLPAILLLYATVREHDRRRRLDDSRANDSTREVLVKTDEEET